MVKMKNKKDSSGTKKQEFVVMSASLNRYKFFDHRANKPITYVSHNDNETKREMVLQEIEVLKVQDKLDKKITIDYFSPNNVGILLSISHKSLLKSQKMLNDRLISQRTQNNENKQQKIVENSIFIYDYIEEIQSCIVFGYTALEAFANLSIPNEYTYKTTNNKGIVEVFDKNAIERWTSLSIKISVILVEIYKTKSIKGTNLWNKFVQFEDLRNSIIHQKAIDSTNFYKKYFYKDISSLCEAPNEIIKFFFNEREDKEGTNPLWPWIINEKNDFPVSYDFKSEKFEIIGNLYEDRQSEKWD